jgi:hypothetical protein
MAKKRKRNSGEHIDRLREKAGLPGTDRFDWTNKTGKSFRAKGEEGKRFPHERPGDITK